jgi:hypothetical protein
LINPLKQIFAWKGLRLIARTRFRYFTELSEEKKMGSMEDLYAIIERDKKGAAPTTNGSHPEEMMKKNDLSKSNELDMGENPKNAALPVSPSIPYIYVPTTAPTSALSPTSSEDGKEGGKEEGKEGEKEGKGEEKEVKEGEKGGVKVKAEPNKEEEEHPPKRVKKDLSPVPNKE